MNRDTMIANVQAMLRPMGWVAIYFDLEMDRWNRFYEAVGQLDPRDVDVIYNVVLMLSQEEWRPVWAVWKQARLEDENTVHEVWMNYKMYGVKGLEQQKLLAKVKTPFLEKLKRLINRWSPRASTSES